MQNFWRAFKSIILLSRRHTWGPFVEVAEKTKFDHGISVSYSQGGEDLALQAIFNHLRDGRYIDVGAHHPDRFSVTRILYDSGWFGVNVDANEDLIKLFNVKRPRDVNICAAVGTESSYELTIFNEPAISTVNPEWRKKFLSENQKIKKVVQVRGLTLKEIYLEFSPDKPVELISIDAEGADFDVLRSLDLENLPKFLFPQILVLETTPPVSIALETPSVKYAMSLGYQPVMVLAMSTILKRN